MDDIGTKIIEWLNAELLDEQVVDARKLGGHFLESFYHVVVMTGKQGQNYCYSSGGELWICFENSAMADLMSGTYTWAWFEKFCAFLRMLNLIMEMCNSWSLSIYEDDK